MTTQAASSVQTLADTAIYTTECYNTASKTLADAYCMGVQRMLNGVAKRYNSFIAQPKLPGMSDDMRAKMVEGQQKLHDFLIERTNTNTKRLNSAMDRVAAVSSKGISAVAERLVSVEQPVAQSIIKGISDLQLPVAKLSARVADKVLAGANSIEARVNGTGADAVAEVKVAKPRAASKARKAR